MATQRKPEEVIIQIMHTLESQEVAFLGKQRTALKLAAYACGYGGAEEEAAFQRGRADGFRYCAAALNDLRKELS